MAVSGGQMVVDIRQAEDLFNRLAVKRQSAVLKSAVRKVMAPVLVAVRASYKAQHKTITGSGYTSLGLQMYRRQIGAAIGARVSRIQPKNLSNISKYNGWYLRFLNTGTVQRFKKKAGTVPRTHGRKGFQMVNAASTGKIDPSNFFNSVVAPKQNMAASDLADAVIWALQTAINRGVI